MSSSPLRVTILGGGVSALTTAFYLSSQPGWRDKYEITVYQQGWRLGGKGASGRNAAQGQRIEEHGLHIFFGFYENAFALMRSLYRELGRNPNQPLADWSDAWKKHNLVVLEQLFRGQWHHWPLDFPEDSGVPGDGNVLPTPLEVFERVLDFILDRIPLLLATPSAPGRDDDLAPASVRHLVDQLQHDNDDDGDDGLLTNLLGRLKGALRGTLAGVIQRAGQDARATFIPMARSLLQELKPFEDAAANTLTTYVERDVNRIVFLLRGFRTFLHDRVADSVHTDLAINRAFILVDLALTICIGLLADGVVFPRQDWYKIDNYEFRAWLRKHGASPIAVHSPPITTLIDAVYASQSNVAAGTILYCMFRLLFTYKGALLYKMQAGMGDVVFTPFYEVLRRRGIKFKFFHQVTELELSPSHLGQRRQVEKIHLGVQAHVKEGGEYRPLVEVEGLECWPSEPLYEQLVEGEALRAGGINLEDWWTPWTSPASLTLQHGVDFDLCVLGIGIGAFPYICRQLIEDTDNPAFADMVNHVQTTQTLGIQLWLRPTLQQLGWPMSTAIGIAYADPLDTWADMSHLIPRETWPAGTVGSVLYNTSSIADDEPLPPRTDHGYPHRQMERARQAALTWWSQSPRHLFPYATQTNDPNELNWAWLHDPRDADGPARFDAQFWISDWNPSDRYVLAVAGSNQHRLRAEQSGYPNLYLTGDWLLTSIAAGCVECATQAGMSTSRAISGFPQKIVGEWLPHISTTFPAPNVSTPEASAAPPPDLTRASALPALPRYIRRDGDMMAFQPYRAAGTTMYNFLLAADYDALAAMCDRDLNIGGTTVYKPFGPFCAFSAAHIKRMNSINPTDMRGWVREVDYSFWVPVVAGRQVGPLFIPDRLAWYMPYVWVDSGVAAEGGREIFGYQKSVANLTGPASPNDPAHFTVDTLVIPTFGPDSEAVVRPLIEVSRLDHTRLGELNATFSSVQALAASLANHLQALSAGPVWLPTLSFGLSLLRNTFQGHAPMVFLKQFPDITDGDRACYQAICECPTRVDGPIQGGFMSGDYQLTLYPYDSHKIAQHLGLRTETDTQGRLTTQMLGQFWVQMSFFVKDGVIIHQNM